MASCVRCGASMAGAPAPSAPMAWCPAASGPSAISSGRWGIVSAGAMRQWGRHATAFVGRRHFDDADLFERRFRFDLN